MHRLHVGATSRVMQTKVRAGGKPLNVARIVGLLGAEVTVVGLADDQAVAEATRAAGRPATCT